MAGIQTKLCKAMNLTCSVHCSDLLPLFCKDCDHLLCCDCVTRDHAGHKLCNVSDVVKDHQLALQKVLNNEKSMLFLRRLLADSQREQHRLALHTEDLLRNVINREEEIIAKVKIWRGNTMDVIKNFREQRDTYLKEKISTISTILNKREKGFYLESERSKLEITHINCEVRRLLKYMPNSLVDETSDLIRYELERPSGSSNYIFGKISEKEMSSDEIPSDEAEKVNILGENRDDKGEFHDCVELHRYRFREDSIKDIIPLQNLHTFLLSSGTVYLCDLNKDDFDAKTILSEVHQIAHIPTSGDVLCLMKGFKEIKRIAVGNVVTTFLHFTGSSEFTSVSSGGNETYACVSRKSDIHACILDIFNELGVILKTFNIYITTDDRWRLIKKNKQQHQFGNWRLMRTMNGRYCIRTQSNIVQLINLKLGETTKTYTGSVGTDPGSRFCTTGMTTDNHNNILLVVQNDNAIHLLDKSLTFQKLLMTAEDGLHCPTSVALDRDGYLWVGCEDGQIHVVNYQYLLNTDRETRLKVK
ncbi:uncharacterized protein LOC125675625 [Ostrea edulis]|uniref:uncharacterized protein LOC125675625 n=1 Tax=Ostrea edulis TaxID=37623 RepID=UPI0024AFA567|nr:uncharacterized protein LOC125675625 [Ostrea edulis]